MSDKKKESFEGWRQSQHEDKAWKMPYYDASREAWNHQQKKIDHYKELAMDNQARYNGALERINELEKQLGELKDK